MSRTNSKQQVPNTLKRGPPATSLQVTSKKRKKSRQTKAAVTAENLDHPVLSHYYVRVQTLRSYLISQLPRSSRIRKKKIATLGKRQNDGKSPDVLKISEFLDSTLVGISEVPVEPDEPLLSTPTPSASEEYKKLRASAIDYEKSQVTIFGPGRKDLFSQDEIVDFCIWQQFHRERDKRRPEHVICDGYERSVSNRLDRSVILDRSIPGLLLKRQNEHVDILKRDPWQQVLTLLGKAGEEIMVKLILDCGIYIELKGGHGNIFQLSGAPLSNLKPLAKGSTIKPRNDEFDDKSPLYTPAQITLSRHRMLYGRAALSSKGRVKTGFRHIHALNRCPMTELLKLSSQSQTSMTPDPDAMDIDQVPQPTYAYGDLSTLKIMAHVFPRQFGLHNVFTSRVNTFQTAQKFQDYTMRDVELREKFGRLRNGRLEFDIKIPKRLRGEAHRLIWRMQVLHKRCSYWELLRYYCPTVFDGPEEKMTIISGPQTINFTRAGKVSSGPDGSHRPKKTRRPPFPKSIPLKPGESISSYATPTHQVSAFCQSVISRIVPRELLGTGPLQSHNLDVILRYIDRFICMRRFEKMTLHDVVQDIKIMNVPWLALPSLRSNAMSLTDRNKRLELIHELVYYIFDSLVTPLLRSNFYATETNTDRNDILYFRHDIWRALAEPQLADLKARMFSELKSDVARIALERSRLGYSTLRLLPKATTMRPIMNLKRRQLTIDKRSSKVTLGPSINSVLKSLHSVVKLEKTRRPELLGSTLTGVEDIYVRLRQFMLKLPVPLPRLYFVKVDFQAAFDTIPQRAVTELFRKIPQEERYPIFKHVEIKPGSKTIGPNGEMVFGVPMRKFLQTAELPRDYRSFKRRVEDELVAAASVRTVQEVRDGEHIVMEGALAAKNTRVPVTIKRNTAFHGTMGRKVWITQYLIDELLEPHINHNIVKIGKKMYIQKQGIPQGSVLSTDLCNLFYAHMEAKEFGFLQDGNPDDSLLMRLIDDSLLITTDKKKAVKFAKTMIRGLPEYGASANPLKSLVNFELRVRGVTVPRADESAFPFCGTVINCRTLSVGRLRTELDVRALARTLTVDNRKPGQNFQKRVLNFFRVQSHAMFYDCTHNPMHVVQANLKASMKDIAERTGAYIKCLPREQKPESRIIIRTIGKLAEVVHLLIKSPSKTLKFPGYKCEIPRSQVVLHILEAFGTVFKGKQDRYREVREWVHSEAIKTAASAAKLPKLKMKSLTQG